MISGAHKITAKDCLEYRKFFYDSFTRSLTIIDGNIYYEILYFVYILNSLYGERKRNRYSVFELGFQKKTE